MAINTATWSMLLGLTATILLILFLNYEQPLGLAPSKEPINVAKKIAIQKPIKQKTRVAEELATPTQKVNQQAVLSKQKTIDTRQSIPTRQESINSQIRLLITEDNPWHAVVLKNNTIQLTHTPLDFDKNHFPQQIFQNRLRSSLAPVVMLLSHPHISKYVEKIILKSHTSKRSFGIKNKKERLMVSKNLAKQRAWGIYNYLFSIPELAPLQSWMHDKIKVFDNSKSITSKVALNEKQLLQTEMVIIIK